MSLSHINYNRDICVFPYFNVLYIIAGGNSCEKNKENKRGQDVDEEHLDAVHVAKEVGMPPEQVFKTLCVRGDKTGVIFAVIPGNGELDLKALARVSGNKRCEMVHLKEVLPLTGYIRGGCSPLGARKDYPVFMDETCRLFDRIAISAGLRGMQILAAPEDLVRATGAAVDSLIDAAMTQDLNSSYSTWSQAAQQATSNYPYF